MTHHYYIPTKGRVTKQFTLSNLPSKLHKQITLVCPEDEDEILRIIYPTITVVAQPHPMSIGEKRAWIFQELAKDVDFAWQLDDDLRFKVVVHDYFRKPTEDQLFEGFQTVESYSEQYDVLGLGTSYMAPKGGVKENYHLGFAFGFSKRARASLEMNRMDVFEDIDYTLQMLRKGIPLAVCYDVVVEQKEADATGGVTEERDLGMIERDFEMLQSFHPDYVKRKERGNHPAAITRISWAKAAEEGKRLR